MYKINSKILQTPMTDGSILLLQPELGLYFELTEVSAVIFSAIVDKKSPNDIIDSIVKEYEITKSQVEQDFDDLLNQLVKNGIVNKT